MKERVEGGGLGCTSLYRALMTAGSTSVFSSSISAKARLTVMGGGDADCIFALAESERPRCRRRRRGAGGEEVDDDRGRLGVARGHRCRTTDSHLALMSADVTEE